MDKQSRAYKILGAAQKAAAERDGLRESEKKQELVRNWLRKVNVHASTSYNSSQIIEKETVDDQSSQEWSDIETDDSVKDPDFKEPIDSSNNSTSSDCTPGLLRS